MNDAQQAIDRLILVCGKEAIHHLWPGNVIHGEQFLSLTTGHSVSMADIGDRLRELHEAGIIKPIRFRPSHSGAAFLGLQEGASKEKRDAPHAGDAAHWEWEVSQSPEGSTSDFYAHLP